MPDAMVLGPPLTRLTLIQRLGQEDIRRTGDWEQFYELYQGWISGIAWRCSLRAHEVDEVLQETMITLLRLFRKNVYQPSQGKFRGFLSGTVKWHVKQALSRRHRNEQRFTSMNASLTECGTPKESSLADTRPLPDEEFDHHVKLALVDEALADLVKCKWVSQERVDIFLEVAVQQKPRDEVARSRGADRNAVYQTMHVVTKRLTLMIRCKEEGIEPADVDPSAAPELRLRTPTAANS